MKIIARSGFFRDCFVYLYDNEEEICGLRYNGTPYYFYKNLQGDIIAITDENGTVQARYTYHAWGVCRIVSDETAAGIAEINPFRYRSYYYDAETGWYYLQSRYYDPEVGRFLNADEEENAIDDMPDHNAFAYTQNNPIMRTDSLGENWFTDCWNGIKKGASTAWRWVKKTSNTAWNWMKRTGSCAWGWIKNAGSTVAGFFKNTIWQKGIVDAIWNTFCKKWVWEKFCKEMVYNTFLKKWVWETFCKKWTWETFCKKWVWETFCKDWVWEGVLLPTWSWLKNNWKKIVDWFFIIFDTMATLVTLIGLIGAIMAGALILVTPVTIEAIIIGIIGLLSAVWAALRTADII